MSQLPHDNDWYYSTAGDSVGPVSVSHLRQLVVGGTLGGHHSVRHGTWDQWYLVHDAAAQLGLAPPVTAPPAYAPGPAAGAVAAPPLPMVHGAVAPSAAPRPAVVRVAGSVTSAQRAASWVVDAAVLGLVALGLSAALPAVVATLLAFGAFAAYTVVLPMKGYATAGHIVVGLRIARIDSDEPLDWLVLGTRAALVLLLSAPCLVGTVLSAITMFSHPSARAWHDVATGTAMVRVKAWSTGRLPVSPTPPPPGA